MFTLPSSQMTEILLKGCKTLTHPSIKLIVRKFCEVSHSMTKPTKLPVHPVKTQICLPPSLISVFAVRMKKPWFLGYPLSAQRRLIRLDRCPGWSESSMGTQVILLVLSYGGSDVFSWLSFHHFFFQNWFMISLTDGTKFLWTAVSCECR